MTRLSGGFIGYPGWLGFFGGMKNYPVIGIIRNHCKVFMGFYLGILRDSLGGGNSNIFGIFTPNLGEDEPILTSIFFRWVGSTRSFLD